MKNQKAIELKITGMTCEHCAASIEALLRQEVGVSSVTVHYQNGSGRVAFDPEKTSAATIVATINSTQKYRATLFAPPAAQPAERKHFDLIILGGGSAAFAAAIKAEELGKSTLMVNGGLDFGGTCVNVGCVPSKYLVRAAEAVHFATHSRFAGITPRGAAVDFARIVQDKNNLVSALQKKKYLDVVADFQHLTLLSGYASFLEPNTVSVNGDAAYTAERILIATGAATRIPEIPGLSEIGYLTHKTLFDLEEKPESLTIMGAGYIGLEIAMAYNRLGVKVRIIEFTGRVLRKQTPDTSAALEAAMRSEGIELLPDFRATKFEKRGKGIIIYCQSADGTLHELVERGRVLVACGTRPNTAHLRAEAIGLALDDDGHIRVNDELQTNIPAIYAAGDVANTPAYVYTAAYEGRIAVENAFTGARKRVDYSALPWVIFTDPQVAGVGIDEQQAEQAGIPHDVSKLSLADLPRAIVANDPHGLIKLIRHSETDELLGARIVAREGGELVEALALAMKYKISVKQLAEELYPYLTLSEGIKLAALGFYRNVHKLSCCAS